MAVVYPSSRHSHGLPKPASATACQVGSTLIWPQRKLVACLLGQVGAPGPGIGSFYGCWFWDEDDLFCQHRMVSWRYSQMYSGWWLNQPISQIKTGSFGIIIPVAVRWKWKPPASFSLYSQNRLLAMQKKGWGPSLRLDLSMKHRKTNSWTDDVAGRIFSPSQRFIFQVEVLGISSKLLRLQHNSIAYYKTVSGKGLLAKSHQIPKEVSKSPKVSPLTEPITFFPTCLYAAACWCTGQAWSKCGDTMTQSRSRTT